MCLYCNRGAVLQWHSATWRGLAGYDTMLLRRRRPPAPGEGTLDGEKFHEAKGALQHATAPGRATSLLQLLLILGTFAATVGIGPSSEVLVTFATCTAIE